MSGVVAVWFCMLLVKPVFGYILQLGAHWYIGYYNKRYQKLGGSRPGARAITAAGASSAAQAPPAPPPGNFTNWRDLRPPQSPAKVSASQTADFGGLHNKTE